MRAARVWETIYVGQRMCLRACRTCSTILLPRCANRINFSVVVVAVAVAVAVVFS